MKKFVAILVLVLTATCSFAQADTSKETTFIHKGILAGVGTVGVGKMLLHPIANVYVTGSLEYYAEQRVSIRGDAYFFINSVSNNSPLKQNSSIYFGAYYHFPVYGRVGRYFDPLIGVQPGLAIVRTDLGANDHINGVADPGAAEPIASAITGFNFFGEKWFHIQFNIRYTVGQESTEQSQFNLDEVSFNFGLGVNFDMIKKHRPFTTTDQNSSW